MNKTTEQSLLTNIIIDLLSIDHPCESIELKVTSNEAPQLKTVGYINDDSEKFGFYAAVRRYKINLIEEYK